MTLWGRRESLHHSQLTATIDQFNPVFNSSSQIMDKYYGSLSGVLNEINNEITQQSLSISANEIFRMAAIAFILLTVLVCETAVYSERHWVMIKGGGYSG